MRAGLIVESIHSHSFFINSFDSLQVRAVSNPIEMNNFFRSPKAKDDDKGNAESVPDATKIDKVDKEMPKIVNIDQKNHVNMYSSNVTLAGTETETVASNDSFMMTATVGEKSDQFAERQMEKVLDGQAKIFAQGEATHAKLDDTHAKLDVLGSAIKSLTGKVDRIATPDLRTTKKRAASTRAKSTTKRSRNDASRNDASMQKHVTRLSKAALLEAEKKKPAF